MGRQLLYNNKHTSAHACSAVQCSTGQGRIPGDEAGGCLSADLYVGGAAIRG